ncbi:MAG: hypothetical protein GY846_20215 [Deltaproteobacteria bacterium]|nr:hypothetical protein [Deltaproteobacteria bacterium]
MRKRRMAFMLNWFFMFFAVVLMSVSCAETKNKEIRRVVGGPCNYKSYPGKAEVVSLTKTDDGYDVKFVFHSEKTPRETYARVEGKTHRLLLIEGSRPKLRFLKKYGIETGKVLSCNLDVIVKGTCTPILFKFPTVDLTDYEANRP